MTSWDSNTNTNASEKVGEVSRSMFGVTWKPKNNISLKMNMGTTDTEDGGSIFRHDASWCRIHVLRKYIQKI